MHDCLCFSAMTRELVCTVQWLCEARGRAHRAHWTAGSHFSTWHWCSHHGWGVVGNESRLLVCAVNYWCSVVSNSLHLAWWTRRYNITNL